jgi:hypothetical protein
MVSGPQILDLPDGDDCDSSLIRELLRRTVGGGMPASGEHGATKALMLAVLEDGLRAFLDRNKRVRAEAERWMMSRRQNWVFSFPTVCWTLGLDPDAVREAAHRMREKNLSPRRAIGRNRRNVRHVSRIAPGTKRGPQGGRGSE